MADEILLAISTFPNVETARRIAETLVAEKLVACANITAPVESIYRWEGKIEQASETMVFFKTSSATFADLETRFRELHPYDVPELIALPITGGLPDYLRWVAASCAP